MLIALLEIDKVNGFHGDEYSNVVGYCQSSISYTSLISYTQCCLSVFVFCSLCIGYEIDSPDLTGQIKVQQQPSYEYQTTVAFTHCISEMTVHCSQIV